MSFFSKKFTIRLGIATMSLAFVFTAGIFVGDYHWPPYHLVKRMIHVARPSKKSKVNEPVYKSGEEEIMTNAFSDPVIEGELIYKPISNLEGIKSANKNILMKTDDFEQAYDNIVQLEVKTILLNDGKTSVVKLDFIYYRDTLDTYAYGRIPNFDNAKIGALIIPGSGHNQSEGIALNDSLNYHYGIMDALAFKQANVFTMIKPNEDILAWHNGQGKKLNGNYIWNWQVNHEGSYSVSYLVQSLAWIKWLKTRYKRTIVVGLSQGGAATMLNALQSKPDIAILSSGHSCVGELALGNGHDQLLAVPGYGKLFLLDTLVAKLKVIPTQWLFTWGKKEEGLYRLEAEKGYTANPVDHLDNVVCVFHEGGHEFPKKEIIQFLQQR